MYSANALVYLKKILTLLCSMNKTLTTKN